MEGHNTWIVNAPGLAAGDPGGRHRPAQHRQPVLLRPERLLHLRRRQRPADPRAWSSSAAWSTSTTPLPLTFLEQYSLTEATAELATAPATRRADAAGDGPGRLDVRRHRPPHHARRLRRPGVPGLGFRFDTDERWALPNPTGLEGVFEAFCPPHYAAWPPRSRPSPQRKFGPGGVYHPDTPGAWQESAASAAAPPLTPRRSRPASACRPSTSSTPSASSPAPCRRRSS